MPPIRAYLIILLMFLSGFSAPIYGADNFCTAKIIVAPALAFRPKLSFHLSLEVPDLILKTKNWPCNPFVPFLETSGRFDLLGSTPAYPRRIAELGLESRRWLYGKTGATHILQIETPKSDGSIYATIYAIDQDGVLSVAQIINLDFPKSAWQQENTPSIGNFIAKILPNSASLGLQDTTFDYEVNNRYTLIRTNNKSSIFTQYALLSLNEVEHPKGLNRFDLSLNLSSSASIFFINTKNTLVEKSNPDHKIEVNMDSFGTCGFGEFNTSFFWPMGTSFLNLGAGLCGIWDRRAAGTLSYLTPATKAALGHRIFFSDHNFVSFSGEYNLLVRNYHSNTHLKTIGLVKAVLGLGYYLEDSEILFLDFWNSIFSEPKEQSKSKV